MRDEDGARSGPARCRSCGAQDLLEVLDLGSQPPAGAFPTPDEAALLTVWPLATVVCRRCWLLQLLDPAPDEPVAATIQATVSSTMAAHAERFVDEVLATASGVPCRILEVASHGGHLAPRFASRGVRTVVVDPSVALVSSARASGLDAEAAALTRDNAEAIRRAYGPFDVIIDSYLLAHQRELDPQLAAITTLLADRGRAVLEFNHVLPILGGAQFDAIRHGHFSYLSLTTLISALERQGLRALSATAQPAYGGGVRLWVARDSAAGPDPELEALLSKEAAAGLGGEMVYRRFAASVSQRRSELHQFLATEATAGRLVVGYGAPSRGNTLLNACGITPDLLPYTVDASPQKQGRLMAGSGVPIDAPERIRSDRPDEILILTWDLADEVMRQLADVRSWGGRFVIPFPALSVR
jgi:C-methyltransferase C-terminal domain/Putative zinc binding domain/Methyltransferase domain